MAESDETTDIPEIPEIPPIPADGESGDEPSVDGEGGGRRRLRRRDPFKGMDQVSSSEAALKGKDLTSRSDLKRLRKTGVRHEGKKVLTDDVKILKSISDAPEFPDDPIHYYREPIRIEYYIPKESRFAVEIRYLYVPLIDPEPAENHEILYEHMENDQFFDLTVVMAEHPEHLTDIFDSYGNSMHLFESLATFIREGDTENPEQLRSAFYMCEILAEYEPTLVALETLGEFVAWNLNWLVRRMNTMDVEFSASDKTISYFIKLRNMYWEENQLEYDERFEILAALFYQQAFPNRGLETADEDFFYDIFEKNPGKDR